MLTIMPSSSWSFAKVSHASAPSVLFLGLLVYRRHGTKMHRCIVLPPTSHGVSHHYFPTGSFAAASNITGALEDTEAITRVLHKGGALSFWDYATAAPYVEIDVNPKGGSASNSVRRARPNT